MSDTRSERTEALLYAALFGALTPGEKRELYGAALEDQDVFESLMDGENLRSALESESNRAILRGALRSSRLRENPAPKQSHDGGSWWVLGWVSAGAFAALLTIILIQQRPWQTREQAPQLAFSRDALSPARQAIVPEEKRRNEKTPGAPPNLEPAESSARSAVQQLFAIAPQHTIGSTIALSATERVIRSGETWNVEVTSPIPARVWAALRDPAGHLFLLTSRDGVVLPEGAKVSVATIAADEGLAAGSHTVRVVVLNSAARLFHSDSLDDSSLTGPMDVRDLTFTVAGN